MKRIGLFGARADNSGLGNQTWEFYRNLKPAKTAVVDISELNGKPNHFERYESPNVTVIKGFPSDEDCRLFLTGLDVVFCTEIPYNYNLFTIAREMGVKSILHYNYEFLDYLNQHNLPLPDVLLAPSLWHFQDVERIVEESFWDVRLEYLPVPVNREKLMLRNNIEEAKTFVHVAGWKLHEDRNGTQIVLDALAYVQSQDIHLIVFTQHDLAKDGYTVPNDPRLEIRFTDYENYWDLYLTGDVLLLPRRYGGLSLQLNEAMSVGMVPIMLEISPQEKMLQSLSLIYPSGHKVITTRTNIECYSAEPSHLAFRMDRLRNHDIGQLHRYSDMYAESISWNNMKAKYEELFETL